MYSTILKLSRRSMEISVNEAFEKAIEAHRQGDSHTADKFYTAVLKAQPNHPDANHNIGVLAVSLGKTEQALPFFKAALKANPNIPQFWISIVDALVQLNQINAANEVLQKLQNHSSKSEELKSLISKLNAIISNKNDTQKTNQFEKIEDPPAEDLKSLIDLYNNKQMIMVLEEARTLTTKYPNAFKVWNILGAAAAQLGKVDAAIYAFTKVISII